MSRTQIVVSTAIATTLLLGAAQSALADQETVRLRCSPVTPDWQQLDCVKTVDNRRDLGERTHISFFPTGNLLRQGEVQYQVHELGLFNRAAYGVSDNVELSAGAPAFPVFASVGARANLLSRESRYRAVVGASIWMPLIVDGDENLVQASGTVAYQDEKLNLHATAGGIKPTGSDETLAMYSVGMVYKTGKKSAFFAEVLRVTMLDSGPDACPGDDGYDCGDSSRNEYLDGAAIGIKLMGKHFDTDLGLLVPFGEQEVRALPVLSMTYRY